MGSQDNFIFNIVLLGRFDCSFRYPLTDLPIMFSYFSLRADFEGLQMQLGSKDDEVDEMKRLVDEMERDLNKAKKELEEVGLIFCAVRSILY